jgi:hypothetical protein
MKDCLNEAGQQHRHPEVKLLRNFIARKDESSALASTSPMHDSAGANQRGHLSQKTRCIATMD